MFNNKAASGICADEHHPRSLDGMLLLDADVIIDSKQHWVTAWTSLIQIRAHALV